MEESSSPLKPELLHEINLPSAALGLSLTPDESVVLVSCLDGGVYSVNLASPNPERIGRHESYASGVVVPEGQECVAVSAGYDGKLQWHSLNAAQEKARVVDAHRFWSWQLKGSPDGKWVASSSGQYLSNGYRYEPAPETEPCVKVWDAKTGDLKHAFSHTPPVLSLGFDFESKHLAAANMMGDIKIWNLETNELIQEWNTPDFTSWGIIKSHHYIGGIFDLQFSPNDKSLLVCGMGPMRDPMAGNGKQTWQRWDWESNPPVKMSEIIDGERGRGLMETLAFHPTGETFCMAGRMAQGNWNVALFELSTGKLLHGFDNKSRVTKALFSKKGDRLYLAGAKGQGNKDKEGKWTEFGRLFVYQT